jgi:hypothetical protein
MHPASFICQDMDRKYTTLAMLKRFPANGQLTRFVYDAHDSIG